LKKKSNKQIDNDSLLARLDKQIGTFAFYTGVMFVVVACAIFFTWSVVSKSNTQIAELKAELSTQQGRLDKLENSMGDVVTWGSSFGEEVVLAFNQFSDVSNYFNFRLEIVERELNISLQDELSNYQSTQQTAWEE
jgi:hypothetical protein